MFFVPCLRLGCTSWFPFSMMQKILVMFAISDLPLLTSITAATFLIFTMFYVLI